MYGVFPSDIFFFSPRNDAREYFASENKGEKVSSKNKWNKKKKKLIKIQIRTERRFVPKEKEKTNEVVSKKGIRKNKKNETK